MISNPVSFLLCSYLSLIYLCILSLYLSTSLHLCSSVYLSISISSFFFCFLSLLGSVFSLSLSFFCMNVMLFFLVLVLLLVWCVCGVYMQTLNSQVKAAFRRAVAAAFPSVDHSPIISSSKFGDFQCKKIQALLRTLVFLSLSFSFYLSLSFS